MGEGLGAGCDVGKVMGLNQQKNLILQLQNIGATKACGSLNALRASVSPSIEREVAAAPGSKLGQRSGACWVDWERPMVILAQPGSGSAGTCPLSPCFSLAAWGH